VAGIDRRQDLLAALELLKVAASDATPKELPPLIREQRAVLKELETLDEVDKEASTVDDLRARRAARRTASGL
jgi:hypothetical protein